MAQLTALGRLGVDLDPPYLGLWPERIGGFILNFANIELISYQFLDALEETREEFGRNTNLLLGTRIDRIQQLVVARAEISKEEKESICALWNEVRECARWRNRIAHNPLLPTWKTGSDSQVDPPDVLGIPDMRQLKVSDTSDSLSMDGLDILIKQTANLAQRLHAAGQKLKCVT